MDLNKAQVIWNITRDIEVKETPNGMKVTNFGVATNRNWTDWNGMRQEQTEFHNIVLWGKLAEIAWEYLKKWQKVYLEGRLQTRSWETQDWSKRYTTEIVWENMIMLWGRWGTDSVAPSGANPTTKQASPSTEEEISIEDIPF